ncbi:MAG: glycosyltransferase family 39 protein, partial [Chloroflexota bacterium]|nr:glycosyltransferase family 39 protein [Chloroflexota bacterium]
MGERVLLLLLLLAAGVLRVALLLGPFGEIDADEAVVGLMALQIPGELPVFFWEQHYLGGAEAFVAAVLFAAFGPSAAALKLAPATLSVLFIWLTYLTARRAFGPGPALLTAAYLALPPSFLAAWSVKARGGYAELLAFGALLLLACQHLADDEALGWRWAALAGLAAGLALWTHPLGIVYLAAGGLYVVLARRRGAPAGIVTPALSTRPAYPARAACSASPALSFADQHGNRGAD